MYLRAFSGMWHRMIDTDSDPNTISVGDYAITQCHNRILVTETSISVPSQDEVDNRWCRKCQSS